MSTLREQLIRIQKKNYRRNIKLVRESLSANRAIDRYESEYKRYVKDFQSLSNKAELIKKVVSSDVVFHGDYHTLRQSQRSVLRVLREVHSKREIILCLEMFHGTDQAHIDRYISGELIEETFLKKIHYKKKWPFNWDNWRPIIDFCRENDIPIFGINTKGEDGIKGLRERDKYSSRIIVKKMIQQPEKLIYVVDGDYHVSPNHLPKEVENLMRQLDINYKRLIIYQNAENLYWKLCRMNKEEIDVLKITDDSYCVMNTMPANKIQSYLNWLEYSTDAYYPVHRDWEDDEFERQGTTIHDMAETIASILDMELPEDRFQKLSIYYASDLNFMDVISDIQGLKSHVRIIRDKIKREEGFLLEYTTFGEDRYLIYLPNSSINVAAEEASHYVNALMRGRILNDLNSFDRFYWNVITECLGFFGSKFINEKRKSQTEYSLRKFLGQVKYGKHQDIDPVIPDAGRAVLQHLYLQKRTENSIEYIKKFYRQYKSRSAMPVVFSTQLGYMLGNRLYYAVKKERFPLSKIRQLFKEPFDKAGEAFNCYMEISKRVKKVKPVSQY